jgi:hypothetical protein
MNQVAYNTSIHNKARFGTNLSPILIIMNMYNKFNGLAGEHVFKAKLPL